MATAKKAPARKKASTKSKITVRDARTGAITDTTVRVSTKALKDKASALAQARSPVRFLGIKRKGASARLATLVAEGLSPNTAEALAGNLEMPASEFVTKYIHIPKQTMARRKAKGKLNVDESDRVARFARLLKQTTDMMEGDQDAAIRWLKSPQVLLDGQTPLEYAITETGAAEVQQLIGRVEYGVYS